MLAIEQKLLFRLEPDPAIGRLPEFCSPRVMLGCAQLETLEVRLTLRHSELDPLLEQGRRIRLSRFRTAIPETGAERRRLA